MSIQTTKTNAHQQRRAPAKLKKAGLHAIEDNFHRNGTVLPNSATRSQFDHVQAQLRAADRVHTSAKTPVRNSTMRGAPYSCPELSTPSTRPGAMDAFRLPSRTSFAADNPRKD